MTSPPISPRDPRLDGFFDNAVDLLCVGDLFGYFLRANRATIETLGFSEEELHKIRFFDLVHADDRQRTRREFLRLSRGQSTRRHEVRFRGKDGGYRWIAWTAFADRDKGLIYAVGRDVGELQQRQAEAMVLNRIRDELWAMHSDADFEKVLVAVREGLEELQIPHDHCGINVIISEDPVLVRAHSMQRDGAWQESDLQGVQVIIDARRQQTVFYRRDLQKDDRFKEIEVFRQFFSDVRSVVDVPFSHGTLAVNSHVPSAFSDAHLATLQSFADILSESFRRREDLRRLESRNVEMSEEIIRRQLAETELRQAHEVAVEASQSKSAFLANTSHEIRTPINAIMGMAQVLEEEQLNPEQADYVRTILQASHALSAIVDDILDLSKIEAGHMELEAIAFSPQQVFDDTRRTLAVRAGEKGLALDVLVDDTVPPSLTGDPGRLRQVLLNLLSNAVKFTSSGGVTVRAGARGVAGATELVVSVADTGIGIPAERRAVIFDPFTQADGSTTRTYGGTGLGLSICRRFVEMMGGRIWVESEPAQGSTFFFTARFGTAESIPTQVEAVPEAPVHRAALRILLVEDNPLNRKVVHAMLRRDGHEIVEAVNGRLAVEASLAGAFDVILMDVQMPEMDGLTATTRIRAAEAAGGRRRVPIVALTAHAMKGDAERCRAAGMDDYLTKPVHKNLLQQLLAGIQPAADIRPRSSGDFDPATLEGLRDLEAAGDLSIAEIVALFIEDTNARLQRLQKAVDAGDAKAVHFEAHTLKGACREVGALGVASTAAALEDQARAGQLQGAEQRLQQIQQGFKVLLPELAPYQ